MKAQAQETCAMNYHILGNVVMASMEVCLCLYFDAMLAVISLSIQQNDFRLLRSFVSVSLLLIYFL